MCFARGSASAALSAAPSARLSERSRNALGCALGALSERIRIKLGTPSAAPSERPQQRPRIAFGNSPRSALGSGCGTLSEVARSALGSALGALSERSRLRSRSAFGTHSDQTRNALGNALGAPSVTPSDRLRKLPFGAHSGVVAERPRQRPRNGRSELVPNPLRGRLEAILEAAWFSGPFNSLGFLFSYLYMLRLKAPLLILTYKNKKFRETQSETRDRGSEP